MPAKYIYQSPVWPHFTWKEEAISKVFGEVRQYQGKLKLLFDTLGFEDRELASLNNLTLDVTRSSEIEGEKLSYDQVRSSIAQRLGINVGGLVLTNKRVEGVVDMMLDATQNFQEPVTNERLFGWHAALFPTGYSGSYKVETGKYRSGEMQIVSGAMGKEKVHYQAIPAKEVMAEMNHFLDWFNSSTHLDPVLRSAIAHFWFIIIHPFDDGNGRIARALSDLMLARADGSKERFYSMSNQIMTERKIYYQVLKKVQHSQGDITEWLGWFLNCLLHALRATDSIVSKVMRKSEFWRTHAEIPFNRRQAMMINKLFDGIYGKLTSSKWAKMAKCSQDTALRDIKDLIKKGILAQSPEAGRSTNYALISP